MIRDILNFRFWICVSLIFYLSNLIAQNNLIYDGGFEEIIHLNNSEFIYKGWQPLHYFKNENRYGNPDYKLYLTAYRHLISTVYLKTWDNFFKPYEGNGLCFTQVASLKNIYQTKLLKPLQKDSIYRISFKYKINADNFDRKEIIARVNNAKIGALLVDMDVANDSVKRKAITNLKLKVLPQIQVMISISDSLNKWETFTSTFKATKNYQYLLLGNFDKLYGSIEVLPYEMKGITFLYDNIEIIKCGNNEYEHTNDSKKLSPEDNLINNNKNIESIKRKKRSLDSLVRLLTKSLSNNIFIYNAERAIIMGNYNDAYSSYNKYLNFEHFDFRNFSNYKKLIQKTGLVDSMKFIKITEDYFEPYKTAFNSLIDSLESIDQLCRIKHDNISHQDSLNFYSILRYMQNNPISTLGLNNKSKNKFLLLMSHHTRYGFFEEIIPILNKILEQEIITSRDYAVLIDTYYHINISNNPFDTYFHTTAMISDGKSYIVKDYSIDEMLEINKKRNQIGLEDLETQFLLQMFNHCNGYSDFEFYQVFTDTYVLEMLEEEYSHNYNLKLKINYCEE
jgi:hypothetical protein